MGIIDLDPPSKASSEGEEDGYSRPREPLFRVGGKVYDIPKEFTASECLTALEIAATSGSRVSLLWLMHRALGDEGWQALKNAEGMTAEQYKSIQDTIEAKSIATSKAMMTGE